MNIIAVMVEIRTINSILRRPLDTPVDGVEDAKRVLEEAPDLVTFIRQMPFFVETEQYILCMPVLI